MTTIKQKQLDEATPAEIKAFAVNFLSLDIAPDATDADIKSAVYMANGGSEIIFIMPQAAPADMAGDIPPMVAGATQPIPAAAMQGTLGRNDPRCTILIANEDRNGEVYTQDVEVGVNGRVWQIKRNVEATIPYRVYLALTAARGVSITHDPRTHEEIHTETRRVPVQLLAGPTAAEIAEWHQRVDSVELA